MPPPLLLPVDNHLFRQVLRALYFNHWCWRFSLVSHLIIGGLGCVGLDTQPLLTPSLSSLYPDRIQLLASTIHLSGERDRVQPLLISWMALFS